MSWGDVIGGFDNILHDLCVDILEVSIGSPVEQQPQRERTVALLRDSECASCRRPVRPRRPLGRALPPGMGARRMKPPAGEHLSAGPLRRATDETSIFPDRPNAATDLAHRACVST